MDNNISTIPPKFAQLQNLIELNITQNNLTDIDILGKLKNLENLYLDGNNIEDISKLANLNNIKTLFLSQNNIKDIKPIKKLKKTLTELIIGDNPIENVEIIGKLTNIISLSLNAVEIDNIDFIKKLKNLENLSLNNTWIENISPLEWCTGLKILELSGNNIKDIWIIWNLINLEILLLGKNNIEKINALSKLENLKILSLKENQISTIKPLESCKSLTILNISDNLLEEVSSLDWLTELESLWIGWNNIKDISCLKTLHKLQKFSVSNNPDLTGIDRIEECENLEIMDCANTSAFYTTPQWKKIQEIFQNPKYKDIPSKYHSIGIFQLVKEGQIFEYISSFEEMQKNILKTNIGINIDRYQENRSEYLPKILLYFLNKTYRADEITIWKKTLQSEYISPNWFFEKEEISLPRDCEDSAFQLYSFLNLLGEDVCLLMFENHMAVGIADEKESLWLSGEFYTYESKKYYLIETTPWIAKKDLKKIEWIQAKDLIWIKISSVKWKPTILIE